MQRPALVQYLPLETSTASSAAPPRLVENVSFQSEYLNKRRERGLKLKPKKFKLQLQESALPSKTKLIQKRKEPRRELQLRPASQCRKNWLEALPTELLILVSTYLGPRDVLHRLRQLSRSLANESQRIELWRILA